MRQSFPQYRKTCRHLNEPGHAQTLTAQKDAVTDGSFGECWSLDATGNWQGFRQDDDGDGNWDLIQARTANTVNEITGISESAGPAWATPAYNAAGNMTTIPQPGDPTKTYTATYDAWNRLVKLVDDDTSDTVAEYQYDGANRRTVQKSYVAGVLDETRHLYYTQPSQWQVVEERVDAETDPDRQFVWGQRYIDDLLLRDRDTNTNGTLDERLYALQDANWNVTALIDTSGDVQERVAYSAYGTPLFLSSAFVPQGSSGFDWETLYAGYRWETVTELFHVRHRVLNSVIGVWVQRDPLAHLYLNLYSYVACHPLVLLDPSGMQYENGLGIFEPDYSPVYEPPQPRHVPPLSERVRPCPCTETELDNLRSLPGIIIGADDQTAVNIFHRGATKCFRMFDPCSDKVYGIAGNQCCYDESGKLITHGAAAGTPDSVSVYADITWPTGRHFFADVWQWFGGLEEYHQAGWAPVNDLNCEENWARIKSRIVPTIAPVRPYTPGEFMPIGTNPSTAPPPRGSRHYE